MVSQKRRCLLVQHGRSSRGPEERFCGFTDPPLSVEGRQEMLVTREGLMSAGFDLPRVWYVSDRRRAIEGFEALTAGLQVPVVKIKEKLREIHFGDYENLTWQELPISFQKSYESALEKPFDLRFPGGESFVEFCERVTDAAKDILLFDDDDLDVGICAHQGSLRVLQLIADGRPAREFFQSRLDNGAYLWVHLSASDVEKWRKQNLSTYLEDKVAERFEKAQNPIYHGHAQSAGIHSEVGGTSIIAPKASPK